MTTKERFPSSQNPLSTHANLGFPQHHEDKDYVGICKFQKERSPSLSADWEPLKCEPWLKEDESVFSVDGFQTDGQLDTWCLENLQRALEGTSDRFLGLAYSSSLLVLSVVLLLLVVFRNRARILQVLRT